MTITKTIFLIMCVEIGIISVLFVGITCREVLKEKRIYFHNVNLLRIGIYSNAILGTIILVLIHFQKFLDRLNTKEWYNAVVLTGSWLGFLDWLLIAMIILQSFYVSLKESETGRATKSSGRKNKGNMSEKEKLKRKRMEAYRKKHNL